MHRTQAAVCIPHPYHDPGHDPHLWRSSKCHWNGTPETRGGAPRSWKVPLGLGGGPGEEYSPIGENWDCDGAEIRLRRREWEGGEWRWHRGVWGWPWRKSGEGNSVVRLLLVYWFCFSFPFLINFTLLWINCVSKKKQELKWREVWSLKFWEENPEKCAEAKG